MSLETAGEGPRTHLLSNGTYSVMVSVAGSGYSRWRDLALTRWREDPTCDPWGFFVFLRDVGDGAVWSAGYQPVGREPERYDVSFVEARAQFVRKDGALRTATEIVVSPECDAEARCVSITNEGATTREIEVTSYSEVVLASAAADSAHPAFSKMFVQTEFVAESGTLLAMRRGREPGERPPWLFHLSQVQGETRGALQFETDRARFIGRGHDVRSPVCIVDARPLSNTAGTVLDPVLALRRRVRLVPGASARVVFFTGVAATRADALALRESLHGTAAFERTRTLASAAAEKRLRDLEIVPAQARLFQAIASRVLYFDPALRAPPAMLCANRLGPRTLWAHGISGDRPIVLVRIGQESELELVVELLRAHEFWGRRGLAVDLVVLNDQADGAGLELALSSAIKSAQARSAEGSGQVFCLRSAALPADSLALLQTAARAIFAGGSGTLSEQLTRRAAPAGHTAPAPHTPPPPRAPPQRVEPPDAGAAAADPGTAGSTGTGVEAARAIPGLEFFNGLGGFAAAGREYVTVLEPGAWTPAPWSNVIANPQFGFLVSADGSGTAWSQNAQQNALTPWSNDPVSNSPAEVIYLRDHASGDLWSATPLPIRSPAASHIVRHGFGHTRFEHTAHGIALELLQFVPLEDPLKISRLKLVNRSAETRELTVTYYLEWVLGNQRARMAPYIVSEIDAATGALLARSPWSLDFPARVGFMDMGGRQESCTADRAEFLGRYGSLAAPAALMRDAPLSNRAGGGLDPCGALQTRIRLEPGQDIELVLTLGQEASAAEALALLERYRTQDLEAVLKAVTDFWDQTLGAIQIKTPDRSMDVLVNGWLLYQTLACRVWARTAFYQSSGAWGYRDQLQDVMALCVSRPALAREQILRAAGRQFAAGDVEHWWLPVTGQGIKTRVADDRVWLPYVVAHYLDVTEDFAALDEPVPFLEGEPLGAEQQELFAAFAPSAHSAPLYAHCVLALDSSLGIGSHGLPLFGTGDWNDGMNRVGIGGRGESVWLGWFLHAALVRFAKVAERRGDADKAAQWRKHAFALAQAIEREAWDGDWYRRGYFDDGTPLGSVSSAECRIDSVAQSWAVISEGADPARAVRAMAAVNAQLVSRSEGLVRLFTPAFDRTMHDPGYIKSYPPGLRENGGQYTHAALWCTLAFALLGDGDRAGELFSLINPLNHAATRASIHRYKVEPYVVCADIYTAPSHIGRGGWTWYTGSAGWMYRTAVEGILGVELRGTVLRLNPCIPRAWPKIEVTFKHGSARYHIAVENPQGVNRGIVRATLDERELSGSPCEIRLADDASYHYVRVTLGVSLPASMSTRQASDFARNRCPYLPESRHRTA